ncbi:hypothetical protein EPO33_01525 [Patescibacteria group bacterium]|nr:MAG: hypothetical protein EPO33_01525 [Patescibacteria group bacterium]
MMNRPVFIRTGRLLVWLAVCLTSGSLLGIGGFILIHAAGDRWNVWHTLAVTSMALGVVLLVVAHLIMRRLDRILEVAPVPSIAVEERSGRQH